VSARDLPTYDPGMLPDDVMELTVSTFSKMGYEQARSSSLRPVTVGGVPGFRYDLQFTRDDLAMRGLALATQRGGKLDLIAYCAPDEYYFAKYQPVIERLFATVSLSADK
jgi:hypothetical protein